MTLAFSNANALTLDIMGGVIQQKKKDIMGGVNMWFCATVVGFCKDINCSSVSVSAGTIHTIKT